MNGVVIACKDVQMAEKLSQCLVSGGITVLGTTAKGATALRLAQRYYEGGVLLCSYALSDMTAPELHRIRPKQWGMVMLLPPGRRDLFVGTGIRCVCMPLNRIELTETIRDLLSQTSRTASRGSKPAPRSEEEKMLVARAKEILMARRHMTEPEAHRYLQKRSMDEGRTLTEIARDILNGES